MIELLSLASIATALYWLLRETDWLRIRLLVGQLYQAGACCQWRLSDSAVTEDMRDELINKTHNKRHSPGEFVYWMTPLCGWGYAYQYKDFNPPISIQLVREHSKITVTNCTSVKALNEVIKAYKYEPKPLRKSTRKLAQLATI